MTTSKSPPSPRSHPSIGAAFCDRLAAAICRFPTVWLTIGLLLAVGAIAITVNHLRFQPDRNDLISDDLEWNQRCIDWWNSFPEMNDVTIIVDSGHLSGDESEAAQAKRAQARAMVDELANRLPGSPFVADVQWGGGRSEFSPRTARLLHMEDFRGRLEQLEGASVFLQSETVSDALGALAAQVAASEQGTTGGGDETQALTGLLALTAFIDAINSGLTNPEEATAAFSAMGAEEREGWQYLESPNGRLLFMRVTPRTDEAALDATADAVAAVRAIVTEVEDEFAAAGVVLPGVGLTGIDVVESDETAVATMDSTVASILAFLAIAILLILAFRSWPIPVLALTALLIGVAWSFGFLTLTVGHLQILSVVFVVILLGLGIDFGIHLVSGLQHHHETHHEKEEPFQPALADAYLHSGGGIVIGALVTAAAFAVTTFTDFRGVAEMGLIAAGGIILCMIAMVTVFPALIARFISHHWGLPPQRPHRIEAVIYKSASRLSRKPWMVLSTMAVLVLVSLISLRWLSFDSDLLAMQPQDMESVQWQQRIVEDGEVSIWYGVSIAESLEEAQQRADAFRALPTVASVGGIGLLFPPDDEEKTSLIRELRGKMLRQIDGALQDLPANTDPARLATQLAALRAGLLVSRNRPDVPPEIALALAELTDTIQRTSQTLGALPPAEQADIVAEVTSGFRVLRQGIARDAAAFLDPSPLRPDDFPASLLYPYIDRTSQVQPRYAAEVTPQLPVDGSVTSPLDPAFLPGFIDDLLSVDPLTTGVIFQIHYSTDLIRHSFLSAGWMALAVVLILVWIVFRSAVDALLCVFPVAIGFVLLFGCMVLVGQTINPANIIMLPMLFGIGVAAGIHVLQRYRLDPDGHPPGMTNGTGKGLTLSCLTTMIGFGSMMIARHRGIAILGFDLTVGIGLTLIACWTVLPAALEIRRRITPSSATHWPPTSGGSTEEQSAEQALVESKLPKAPRELVSHR